mmetsp:Transcript_32905/g.81789  ORF Transcript_32905/g.81789 Transcript_32905/m.81789 type:complete len:143 (+) Transcript_32905:75-503(+)
MASGHRCWRTAPNSVVNEAVLEFELWSLNNGHTATAAELICMDESLADMGWRQAGYSVGGGAAMLAATHVKLFPRLGTRMRLPIVPRLVATTGAVIFATDLAVFHSNRHLLGLFTSLPESPIGEHLQRKFGIASARASAAGV